MIQLTKNTYLTGICKGSFIGLVAILFAFPLAAREACRIDVGHRPVSWFCPAATGNYRGANRSSSEINYIVIHAVQGSLDSAVNTFQSGDLQNPRSAHFTIGKDGEVVKSVQPHDIAWHAGTSPIGSGGRFESAVLNANSIGIEHAGYVDDENFPTNQQYITSAALVRLLCAQYDIPIDRDHIVGHDEIKSTKQDPGPNWDWPLYMQLVKFGSRTIKAIPETPAIKPELVTTSTILNLGMIVGGTLVALLFLAWLVSK